MFKKILSLITVIIGTSLASDTTFCDYKINTQHKDIIVFKRENGKTQWQTLQTLNYPERQVVKIEMEPFNITAKNPETCKMFFNHHAGLSVKCSDNEGKDELIDINEGLTIKMPFKCTGHSIGLKNIKSPVLFKIKTPGSHGHKEQYYHDDETIGSKTISNLDIETFKKIVVNKQNCIEDGGFNIVNVVIYKCKC